MADKWKRCPKCNKELRESFFFEHQCYLCTKAERDRLQIRVGELEKVAEAAERYCNSTEDKYEDDDPRGNQGLMYNRLKFALGPIQARRCCANPDLKRPEPS